MTTEKTTHGAATPDEHLDPAKLIQEHPRLVVCSISGFGQYGPLHQQAAYDTVIQAISGIMDATGAADGGPTRVGTSISDILGGVYGYCGIVTALAARERTGKGTTVDVAMLDATFATLEQGLMDALGVHKRPRRIGNRHPSMAPFDVGGFQVPGNPIKFGAYNSLGTRIPSPELNNRAGALRTEFAPNADHG